MKRFDAVLVLGGGVREGGILPSWVQRRFQAALAVPGNPLIMPVSAATTHRPTPLTERGFPLFEATAGAEFLMRQGIPASRILMENCSWDTVGNAYFSRTVHAEPRRLRRLLVITSDWHMPRSKLMFDWVYRLKPRPVRFKLAYQAVDDPEMESKVRAERTRKEQASMDALQPLVARIKRMPDFHRWLFGEHNAYRAGGNAFDSAGLSEEALASY